MDGWMEFLPILQDPKKKVRNEIHPITQPAKTISILPPKPKKKRSEKKGMTPNEIYASSFDLSKLNDAHNYCRKVFDEAIETN